VLGWLRRITIWLSDRVLSITDWIGLQLHISSKWASRVGVLALWGASMTLIQVDEYGVASLSWVLSAVVLFSKAIHWDGLKSRVALRRWVRSLYFLSAIAIIPVSLIWTQAKRGEKPWTAFRWPGHHVTAPPDVSDAIPPTKFSKQSVRSERKTTAVPDQPPATKFKPSTAETVLIGQLASLGWTVKPAGHGIPDFSIAHRGLPPMKASASYFQALRTPFSITIQDTHSVSGLSALKDTKYLRSLRLNYGDYYDLASVRYLHSLTSLEITQIPVTDLSFLRSLSNLKFERL
jgi:hypothetical protein